jgi:aspartate kinase
MPLRVIKFGGTSVGDPERIVRVARRVQRLYSAGETVIVVVSAMAGDTDRLLGLVERVTADGAARDTVAADQTVAAGEIIAAGLLAQALISRGVPAVALTGPKAGIKVADEPTRARITDIDTAPLRALMDAGQVAVVTGFQGESPSGAMLTLGRGGSDTTAVAIAAALKAQRCDIFTDVDGVYTTDPRIVEEARRLDHVSYEEMLEMAALGAKVLHTRSVEIAMAYGVPIRVASTFADDTGEDEGGTWVTAGDQSMEKRVVSGIAYSRGEARLVLRGLPSTPAALSGLFRTLGEAGINVDMIVHSPPRSAEAGSVAFTFDQRDMASARTLLEAARADLRFDGMEEKTGLAKVSVIGVGMRHHAGVAHTLFAALAERNIAIDAITTSEIKVSVLIPADSVELAVRALHAAFHLDNVS